MRLVLNKYWSNSAVWEIHVKKKQPAISRWKNFVRDYQFVQVVAFLLFKEKAQIENYFLVIHWSSSIYNNINNNNNNINNNGHFSRPLPGEPGAFSIQMKHTNLCMQTHTHTHVYTNEKVDNWFSTPSQRWRSHQGNKWKCQYNNIF